MSLSEEYELGLGALEGAGDSELDPELLAAQLLEDDSIVQQVTRTCVDGIETVVAYYRCVFEAGQQRFVVHIPFAPILKVSPSVEAMLMDEISGRIRVTDAQRFGVRVEVALHRAAPEPCTVLIEVIVTA